jgi:hypothetical protein
MSADRPTVLDYEISDDREQIIVAAERGDLQRAVAADRDLDSDEIEELLEEIPSSIAALAEKLRWEGSR